MFQDNRTFSRTSQKKYFLANRNLHPYLLKNVFIFNDINASMTQQTLFRAPAPVRIM